MLSIDMYSSLRKWAGDIRFNVRQRFDPQREHIESKVDIINWLGQQHHYRSFLQISTYTTGGFYDRIDATQYPIKTCLNYLPANGIFDGLSEASVTKDHSFALRAYDEALQIIRDTYEVFDVIFVDSFHSFEQSNADLDIALSLLSPGGTIVVHDCYPIRQQDTGNTWKKGTWLGQTYASFIHFRARHPYMQTAVVNVDFGCGLIRPSGEPIRSLQIPSGMAEADLLEWDYFSKHSSELLNLLTVDEFKHQYGRHTLTRTMV